MSALVAVLMEARARIDHPAAWTQGESARDAGGDPCAAVDDVAACWCALGSIEACRAWENETQALITLSGVARDLGHDSIGGSCTAMLNDAPETTHADVLALYDLAIERAEAAS